MPNEIITDPAAWSRAENVLCVRLDALGDLIMTTPAMWALKQGHPERRLTLLTSPAGAAVAPLLSDIDDVLVYDAPWMKATAAHTDSQPEYAMVEQLRAQRFDAAAIFTVYSQNPLPTAMLCYLADIPLRLAYCHENPYQLLSDWIRDPEPEHGIRHEVRRHLDMVAAVGCHATDERMRLGVPAAARSHIHALLDAHDLDWERPWIVLHVGATALSRRYPPERFAAVAERLAVEDGMQIVFTGTASERDLVEQVRHAMHAPSISLVDALNLAQLAALLEYAPLLLSNNTGTVHVAAAVGTPVVVLYALTNPQHTPWGVPNRVLFHDVPCKWCYKSICPEGHNNCLHLVEPGAAVAAVRELCNVRREGVGFEEGVVLGI